jgi:dethiobiotin synthetase/adenosylmethionine--8-amino-7-oxononanoate aminotransferase
MCFGLLIHSTRHRKVHPYNASGRRLPFSSCKKIDSRKRTNLIFGANTDVGKTIVSAGLVQASLRQNRAVHYIKPLQCGGNDEAFVDTYARDAVDPLQYQNLTRKILFSWETASSPHSASILEGKPICDQQLLAALRTSLEQISHAKALSTTYIETAGGVLSPSAASPENVSPRHAKSLVGATDAETSWGWITQGDLYQPFIGFAPVVLVGDGRLGGISCTLSALESLILRGYDIAALVILETPDGYDNMNALRDYICSRTFRLRGGNGEEIFSIPSQSMVSLPPIPTDPNEPLFDWFASAQVKDTFTQLEDFLQNCWEGQVADLRSLSQDGSGRNNAVWWPIRTNENESQGSLLIDSAVGDHFNLIAATKDSNSRSLEHQVLFDATASWWTQGIGHGESSHALAASAAAGRYGHVSVPSGITHAPAVALAQSLVGSWGPGANWASRVFFTDDGGSSAVEVAIKMGIKTFQKRLKISDEEIERTTWSVCAQEDCYHGDTLGALMVGEPYYDREHVWYEEKNVFLMTPIIGFKEGELVITLPECMERADDVCYQFESIKQIMHVDARMLSKLFSLYRENIEMQLLAFEHRTQRKVASVVVEPILQCTGGLKYVDPLWQRALMEIAESRKLPVIFDETTVGFHRLGFQSSRQVLKKSPDIAIYSKLLTGGLVPFGAVLTSEEIYESFSADRVDQLLLNGNSYVAYPIGCVSALHAFSALGKHCGHEYSSMTGPCLLFDEESVKSLSQIPRVDESFTLGTVVSVRLQQEIRNGRRVSPSRSEKITQRLKEKQILAHPLADVIYVMVSPLTGREECSQLLELLKSELMLVCGEKG